ncbi:glycerate kinase [Cryobacterium sp. BB736]|uniref:glycerate kinase family protein n=1 Tax=Cryobacterium sp. BB736 TaxID=2746963 RepID=UPI001D0BE741|nr:glycerate kinase [Cryobacterium sp. BB736]
MRVVLAPDSFKGSTSATRVAHAIARGWSRRRPDDDLVLLPQADGGEGTLDAIEAAIPDCTRHTVTVTGPDGVPTRADWLELPGRLVAVELAQSSGLPLMATLDPLGATTRGLGEVIRDAVTTLAPTGIRRLMVGLGGSASTDGGTGALTALGARFLDFGGRELPDGGGHLNTLRAIDLSAVNDVAERIVLLTDVDAPLTGPHGAAFVFGPQKGADHGQVELLDHALDRLSQFLRGDPSRPGAGAAGGTGYGLATALGAELLPGGRFIAELTGLPEAIRDADVVITGEGRFDRTSLSGKVVGGVIELAEGKRTIIVAGVVEAGMPTTFQPLSLAELAGSPEASLADPEGWLEVAGEILAQGFTRSPGTPPHYDSEWASRKS